MLSLPLIVLATAIACHLFFCRHEPSRPLAHLALLVLPPTALAFLLRSSFASTLSLAPGTPPAIFALYYTALALSVVVYRLSPFHPLARYPGPIACRVSKLWMAWVSLHGKQFEYYSRLHRRYGDVVRIGPNELSIRDAHAIEPLMGANGLPKGPHWDGRMAEQTSVRTLISIRDPVEHSRRRRPWARAFSVAAIKGYECVLGTRVHDFVAALDQDAGRGPVDLSEWISRFTFDFMSDMAFGGGSEMLRDGDKDKTWHLLESGLPLALVLSHVPWLGQYYTSLPGVGGDLKKFRAFCQERALRRRAQGSQTKDLFHYLIDESGQARHPPTFGEVASDGVLAIVAGSDTTATTLSCLFYFLLTNRTAYRRLQAEVDRFYPPGADPCMPVPVGTGEEGQGAMRYLGACINEALRLYPPVMSGSQRHVPRGTGGKFVGPYFLPEGTSAFVHTYSLHRDPRYFAPFPDTFWPERWLSEEERCAYGFGLGAGLGDDKWSLGRTVSLPATSTQPPPVLPMPMLGASTPSEPLGSHLPLPPPPQAPKPHPIFRHTAGAFIPFSHGPNNCVGRKLALTEMRALVCGLMQRFEMRLADGYDAGLWEQELRDYFVTTRGALPVVLTPRQGRGAEACASVDSRVCAGVGDA